MSEDFLIAIVVMVGSALATLAGAFVVPTIGEFTGKKVGCASIGFGASLLGLAGLIVTTLFAVWVFSKDESPSDMSSQQNQEAAPTSVVVPSSNIQPNFSPTTNTATVIHVERQETGASTYKTYTVTLGRNEALFGDALDVEDQGYYCVAFWAQGPATITFSVMDGAWDRYSNVASEAQLQELLQSKHQYLQNQHWYCKNVDVPIFQIHE